jgi:hypothetical protein
MAKKIEKPVYRKIVRYKPNNQNIGIAIITDINNELIFKSSYKIDGSIFGLRASQYSDLIAKAIQVHKMHKLASLINAIALFE